VKNLEKALVLEGKKMKKKEDEISYREVVWEERGKQRRGGVNNLTSTAQR